MRKLIFFNNASFKLAAALTIDSQYGSLRPDRTLFEANLDQLPEAYDGCYTVATITNPSLPDIHEVVFLLYFLDVGGYTHVLAERGQEGTDQTEWPVGSLVECRVTQGMLTSLGSGTTYNKKVAAISINGGDVTVDRDAIGNSEMIRAAWAIGGIPAAPARAYGDDGDGMAQSVEGVGYSNVVELGVAPDYNPANTYYPGDYAKDTASPFWTWAYGRGNAFPKDAVELGDAPWVRYAPEDDSNYVAFPRLSHDLWFYPTEIGFICEAYTATSVPIVVVEETDYYGTVVGNLVASKSLTGIGAKKRLVLANNITKGINGLNFVRATAAAGGTCRGRFYWKGLFIATNSAEGFPSMPSSTDGMAT